MEMLLNVLQQMTAFDMQRMISTTFMSTDTVRTDSPFRESVEKLSVGNESIAINGRLLLEFVPLLT